MSATNRGAKRHEADFYPTDPLATRSLFGALGHIAGSILEPCAGDGAIIREAVAGRWTEPQQWTALDIRPYQGSESTDFLKLHPPPSKAHTWSITNPPFGIAREFIDQARRFAVNVWMFLRVNFLGSKKRREWWQHNPLTHLWVLSKRPSHTGDGRTDATEYAWFGWCPDLAPQVVKSPMTIGSDTVAWVDLRVL